MLVKRAAALVASLSCFLFTSALFAQASYWLVPPYTIDFTTSKPTVAYGMGFDNWGPTNSVFDDSGRMLFYVEGTVVGGEDFDFGSLGAHAYETLLIPMPGNCNQYYIVYSLESGDLYYSVVDVSQKRLVQEEVHLARYDSAAAMAASRLRGDGSRLLYSVAARKVQKFLVSRSGISLESTTLLDNDSPAEVELSRDGKRLAWISHQSIFPDPRVISVINLDGNGDFIALHTQYIVGFSWLAGLEFSPDGSKLFHSAGSMGYINLSDGTRNSLPGYGYYFLESAADGKIYAAGRRDLGAIDPLTLSFTPAAIPDVAGIYGDRGKLPHQIDGESQRTCDTLCGNPALIQSRYGAKGNFEVVAPYPAGGLAHYWRDNDDPNQTWHGPNVFGVDAGSVDALSLIQSNFGGSNFEVVARIGDQLAHFWRDSSDHGWHGPTFFASGVTATPSLLQSRFGRSGNFEVIVPLLEGGLAHFWRNNDDPNQAWYGPTRFGQEVGPVADVSLIQGSFGDNFEVVARIGNRLAHFWRDSLQIWHGPLYFASGIRGTPALIQSQTGLPGNFEVLAPLTDGGLGHFWRDNSKGTLPWASLTSFGEGQVRSVSLIQSNYGGNLEAVVRTGCNLVHYWRGWDMNWYTAATLPE